MLDSVLRALARVSELEPDYVAVRDVAALREVTEVRGSTAILAAARVGRVRLIDNLLLSPEEKDG